MSKMIVVVGVDGTRTSILGAKEALWLADQLGAELHMVNVGGMTESSAEPGMADAVLENVLEGLKRGSDSAAAIVTAVTYGSPAAALIAYADDVEAQILVAGNRQMKGLGRMLGSVGAQIARDANCAVYIPRTVELVASERAAAADDDEDADSVLKDNAVSDSAVSDSAVSDSAVSDSAVSDSAVSDNTAGESAAGAGPAD